MSRYYCDNDWEHRRQAERDFWRGRPDYEMQDRQYDDECARIYMDEYRRQEREAEYRAEERALEEARERRRMEERQWEAAMEAEYYAAMETQQYSDPPVPQCDICGQHEAVTGVNGYGVCSEGCAKEAESREEARPEHER